MLNMLKLKTSPNHSKSLTLGSRDSFLSNFNIFEKINSDHLTLQPRNPKILGNVPHSCPSKKFFILTLHTHRQSLDWPFISILTSQPIHETSSGPWKTSYMFSIYEKTVNRKTSWKVSFGSYRGPLKSQLTLTSFVKFGLKTAWDIFYDMLWLILKYVNFWLLQRCLSTLGKILGLQKINLFSMKEWQCFDEAWGF